MDTFTDHEMLLYDDLKVELQLQDAEKTRTSKGLLVTVNATHGGYINRNFYFYSPKGMKSSVRSWVEPFNKPVLRPKEAHRPEDAEPIGRVVDARYIGNDSKGFIQLDLLITDKDAIEKVMDQRYLTVSTAQKPVEYVKCSICGKDMLRNQSWCGHSRGRSYEVEDGVKKVCFWSTGRLEYGEVSFVNKPADQSKEHAAMVRGFKFADQEGDVPFNTQDTTEYKGIIMMDTDMWKPENDGDYQKVLFLMEQEVDVIANPSLWDSIEAEDTLKRVQEYVEMGGSFHPGIADADLWVPDEEELQMLDWLEANLALEDRDTYGDRKLTDYQRDDVRNKRHKHVVYMNEAANGHTDYAAGHSHEVINGKVMCAQVFDPKNDKYIEGHDHDITGDAMYDAEEDTELFDKATSEKTKKEQSKSKPENFCGPMDPRKDRRSFPVNSCSQARSAMRLLPKYKGPGDKSRIKACIKRRAKDMGCPFTDELEQSYEIAAALETI